MFDKMRREFIALFGGVARGRLAACAQNGKELLYPTSKREAEDCIRLI